MINRIKTRLEFIGRICLSTKLFMGFQLKVDPLMTMRFFWKNQKELTGPINTKLIDHSGIKFDILNSQLIIIIKILTIALTDNCPY